MFTLFTLKPCHPVFSTACTNRPLGETNKFVLDVTSFGFTRQPTFRLHTIEESGAYDTATQCLLVEGVVLGGKLNGLSPKFISTLAFLSDTAVREIFKSEQDNDLNC